MEGERQTRDGKLGEEQVWMPDVMHPSETGQAGFDASGAQSESYSALFELLVDAAKCEKKEAGAAEGAGMGGEGARGRAGGAGQTRTRAADAAPAPAGPAGPAAPAAQAEAGSSGRGAAAISRLGLGLHAGPRRNLADDPHARSRDGTWPGPLQAVSTKTHAPSGSPQQLQVAQVPVRYKCLSDLSAQPMPNRPLDSRAHARLPPDPPPSALPALLASAAGSADAGAAPAAAPGIPSLPVSPHPPSPNHALRSLSQSRRLLRRSRSRDLSTVRRELAREFAARSQRRKSSMDADPQQLLACSIGSPQNMSIVSSAVSADVPRYAASRPPGDRPDYPRSPFSLSAENLHGQYPAGSSMSLPTRPHSMSSLQVTPVTEVQYSYRRASEPTDHSVFPVGQSFSNEELQWNSQSFTPTVGHSITESPTIEEESRWEDKIKLEEEWAFNESQVLPQQLASMPQEYHTPQLGQSSPINDFSGNSHDSHFNATFYARQPPSPALEGEETSLHIKRAASANSSVPSPPESPGFVFSTASSQLPTPEIGFPQTPTLGNGSFHPMYTTPMPTADHLTRQTSIPPTPSSRRSSVSHCSAIQAASAALSATATSSKSATKSRPNSRPGSSRRKTSNGSMRSASHCSPTMDSEMSFVNFTPNDASRILSGVAPSGSSKTKARREREAMEKRRKLSEAATAAVRAVGGDTSVLSTLV